MFKKTLAVIAALFASTTEACDCFDSVLSGQDEYTEEVAAKMWESFEKNEGLESPNAEKDAAVRKTAFEASVKRVIEHNSQSDKTYTKGINKFSDLTDEELVEYFRLDKTGLKEEQHCSATQGPYMPHAMVEHHHKLPPHWDWRQHRGVSPVKNQGSCGSCWTFSTVGALEAHMLLKYGHFTPLSEQQLVDCAGDFDNHGCEGGLPSHAFEYINIQSGGISTNESYPYTAKDDKCTANPETFVLGVRGGSVNITEGDEGELARALFHRGPVSVAFQVVDGFRDYKTGVYTSKTCKNTTQDVNHAVLAVGYGEEDGMKYWIVKNSWGKDWGDEGYFKIEAGVNMCGIAVCNSYPADVHHLHHEGVDAPMFLQY